MAIRNIRAKLTAILLALLVCFGVVLGGQGNLWAESVPTFRHAEYMAWPRGWALAEVLWTGPEQTNWDKFWPRVEQHFVRANAAQINYARSMYNAIITPSYTADGTLGTFKRGAFQLADDLQLPVVPVTIRGSFEVLPKSAKWVRRHRLELIIHQPIPPQGKGPENVKELMARTYEAVADGLKE